MRRMRYDITVKYKNKEITAKGPKYLEGKWELKDFLKHVRISQNISYQKIRLFADISPKRLTAMENGEIDITDDYLPALQKIYKFPRKFLDLTNDKDKPVWASRLTKIRTERLLTQKRISEILEISPATYAGYETGKHQPDLETLIKLADYYQISLDVLTGRSEW